MTIKLPQFILPTHSLTSHVGVKTGLTKPAQWHIKSYHSMHSTGGKLQEYAFDLQSALYQHGRGTELRNINKRPII